MSETFKSGRGPRTNSRYKNKYDDLDFTVVVAIVVILVLGYLLFPKQQAQPQAHPAQKTRKAKHARRRPAEPFNSIAEVQNAIRKEGLESCNLILAIDFTKSNQWNGSKTFAGNNLHDVSGQVENPYQRVIGTVARTLEPFDDDHIIPTFGFGDVETKANKCFPFYPDRHCIGLNEVLERYTQIAPGIQMSGPTSFAPCINQAIELVKQNDHSFHLLVIIADGQVDRRDETIRAIVEASKYPLAIVCIGVGDGPWEDMIEFDDAVPEREFDNFQFVDFHAIETESLAAGQPVDPQFAMCALMELPAQYKSLKLTQKI